MARDLPQYIEGDEFDYTEAFTRPKRTPAPPPVEPERRRGFFAGFDMYFALVVGVLCALGLLMVYSASIDVSYQVTGKADSTTYFFVRQARSMVIGSDHHGVPDPDRLPRVAAAGGSDDVWRDPAAGAGAALW